MKKIPSTMTVADLATGAEETKAMEWGLLPPPKGNCQVCGRMHDPAAPHDPQQLYYQVAFNADHGRAPTWKDAIAHCEPAARAAWEAELRRMGVWTEPPAGA